uniref:Transcriptional regulator n=1 Tax=Anisakis simplex TaxID=6269 RepID=A0A0M3JAH4_ANISI
LLNDNRSDIDIELKERLESEFASLSPEVINEFMHDLETAVQQHRRHMAAKAAALISELPQSKRHQLLQKLFKIREAKS